MQKVINRPIDSAGIKHFLTIFPVTAILGPRQSGKTFLAKPLPYKHYFDLENPRDMTMLNNPQLALEALDGLIVIPAHNETETGRSPLRVLLSKFANLYELAAAVKK